MNKSQVFIFLLCFILGVFVARLFYGDHKVVVKTERVTDTFFVEKVDTQFIEKPVYVTKRVTDTLYLPCEGDYVELPITSKHYKKEGVYDAWVSGYDATLDSIMTYNKTEYKTITNTITNTVEKKKKSLYANVGVMLSEGSIMETVGVTLNTRKKCSFTIQVCELNGKLYYGGTFGYKLK